MVGQILEADHEGFQFLPLPYFFCGGPNLVDIACASQDKKGDDPHQNAVAKIVGTLKKFFRIDNLFNTGVGR